MSKTKLARKVSLPLLTFYGLGTILGAGIYVLIGEVTLRAQQYTYLSFIISATIAGITAYSFARLASMHPKSAGEAAYIFAAFQSKRASALTGLAVILIGSVSAATMVRGFTAYFMSIYGTQELLIIFGIISFITIFSIWGISQSIWLATVITVIEILGLIFVIYVVLDDKEVTHAKTESIANIFNHGPMILYAAFISFYAYIGFEDIVNIAEETIDAKRVVPLAILLSLIISTILYVLLAITCTTYIPLSIFETSDAPLVSIIEYKGYNTTMIAMISMVAIVNGALVQQIMASRVLYGMSEQKLFIPIFKQVNPRTQTPIIATIFIAGLILFLSLSFNLVTLAEITSAITLLVFISVQLSLIFISIKLKSDKLLDYIFPGTGIILNIILIIFGFFII